MTNMKYGHRCDFRALVIIQHTLVLVILIYSCGGHSQLIGTSQPIVAIVGDDVILPCQLEPAVDAREVTVEWARPDLNPKYVLLRRDGTELQQDKHPSYKGRTSLSEDKLRCGDISLKLTDVKHSDSGAYRCLIPATKEEHVIKLTAGSVSSPTVTISKSSSGVDLHCESEGWYPKPEVLWLNSEGVLLPAGSTETITGSDGLFTVSNRVTVERRRKNKFTCRVTQNNINQTRETHIHVPDELFMVQSGSIIRITICVGVCVASIVALFVVVRKNGQIKKNKKHHDDEPDFGERQNTEHDTEHQLLLEKRNEAQPRTGNEKMKLLDNINTELDEKLEKKEKKLEHIQQVITTLTKQKEDLKTQRNQIISLQEEDKIQMEKIQKVLIDTNFLLQSDKKKICVQIKERLEKTHKDHDELLKNTETQLESTDGLINKMTERKGKLENDKEQIKKYIKDTERKREEVQKQIQREEVQKQIQGEEVQKQIQGEEVQKQIQGEEVQIQGGSETERRGRRQRKHPSEQSEEEKTENQQTQPPEGEEEKNNPFSNT